MSISITLLSDCDIWLFKIQILPHFIQMNKDFEFFRATRLKGNVIFLHYALSNQPKILTFSRTKNYVFKLFFTLKSFFNLKYVHNNDI